MDRVIQAARRLGPLLAFRSRAFVEAPDIVKVAILLVAGEAWVIGDGLVDSSLGEDYPGGRYHRSHLIPALGELQRRRYSPTGDRDVWIRYVPDGLPAADEAQSAA